MFSLWHFWKHKYVKAWVTFYVFTQYDIVLFNSLPLQKSILINIKLAFISQAPTCIWQLEK